MRGKIKLVSFVLCAVLMLGFAFTANAQTNWNVSSNPNQVTWYGVTELMGRVRLQVAQDGTTVGSTITVTYQGVTIKNDATSGITLGGTLGGVSATIASVVAQGGTGGQVIIAIADGVAVSGTAPADELTIDGVRADVSALAVATDVQASLSSTSSTANTFVNVSVVRVATVNKSFSLSTKSTGSSACLAAVNPTLTITEGFSGAFAQYVTAGSKVPSADNPAGARVPYGANRNVQIGIVVSGLPTGVTLTWPTEVQVQLGSTGEFSFLEILGSQSASGDSVVYQYATEDQGIADQFVEEFAITPVITIPPNTSGIGTATVQARLQPVTSSTSTEVPRFAHPYINSPADNLLGVSKCTTNLLFTFLTNATGVGFDSGMAIANTTMDPYGTTAQSGPITLYFYGTNAPPPLTTADIAAGTEWTNSLSTIAPGFQGYVIAVTQFQFAHGYAFITGKYNPGSVYDVAEGYVAIVIPDPSQTPDSKGNPQRQPSPPAQNKLLLPPPTGEQLGQ